MYGRAMLKHGVYVLPANKNTNNIPTASVPIAVLELGVIQECDRQKIIVYVSGGDVGGCIYHYN